MKLTIDNRELETDEPLTIYHAAQRLGIDIPVMCYKEGYDYFTSCMICVVKDRTSGRMIPACSGLIADGMQIETQGEEVRASRRSTLELLLSDHVGDCEAPCQRLCAIHSVIPKMIREIKDHQLEAAIATIRADMAIPSILERFCNAPCEKGCRRGQYDEGVSIRHLTRYASDHDLRRESPYLPPRQPLSGKKIAVIGAGVTGLATASYLAMAGHDVRLIEKEARVGGRLHTEFAHIELPAWVLAGELRVLKGLGVELVLNSALGTAITLDQLRTDHDAVILTCGETDTTDLESLGLPVTPKGLQVNPKTGRVTDNIFAAGSLLKSKLTVLKAVQNAKDTAAGVSQFVKGEEITGIADMYNHMMGRLLDGEIDEFIHGADPRPRLRPADLEADGFCPADAVAESGRCMHCDCRAAHDCKLRIYSNEYGAKQNTFKGEERARHVHLNQNASAVYEPGKCIKCGLCVKVTHEHGEPYGFTFVGRGFQVKAGVSLHKTLQEGLKKVAHEVTEACPTGALSENEKLKGKLGNQ